MAIINGRGRVGIRRPSAAAAPSIVLDGLKLYLDAGNTSSYAGTGTVWTDISGNGNNGTLNGAGGSGLPSYNSANGGSIAFDGTDDRGTVPYTIQNQFTNKISINAWVNPAWFDTGNNDGVVIIAKALPTITPPYTMWYLGIAPNGKIICTVGDGSSRIRLLSTNTISLNTWVNLCMTYDGAIIKIYLNGIQDPTTEAATYTLGQNTVPVTIGSFLTLHPFYDWFKGKMGVIQLYNKGLSATEITQNYNTLKSRFYPQVSDADAQAFIYAANIQNSTQANAVNTLVTSMKTAGVWTKMKAVYPMVGGSAASHKFNLKDPRDLDAAYRLAFTAGWVHSSTGAKPNGTSDYANTYLNPFINLTGFSQHVSMYSQTQNITSSGVQLGCYDGSAEITLYQYFASVSVKGGSIYSYPTTAVLNNNTNTKGYQIISRTSNNLANLYFNGINLNTNTTTETRTRPNKIMYLGASNFNTIISQYTPHEFSFATIGDGLTNAEASSLYTAVQAFQTSLGRQV